MDTEFQRGFLAVDFPSDPFHSPWRLLLHSTRVYISNLPFLAILTLIVFLPTKLALQGLCEWLDIPKGGLGTYVVMDVSDLVLSALAVPAAIYGLMARFRTGNPASLKRSLAWGWRQWPKTLWNKFKVETTIALYGALLLVPGIVAMVRLIFADPVVAIEADRESDVLSRSRTLSSGRGWRIFGVLAPVMIVELAGTFLILDAIGGTSSSRITIALVDSLLSVGGQWSTVIVLLMYLGVAPREPAAGKRERSHR